MEDLRSLLFSNDVEIITKENKEDERNKSIETFKNVKGNNYICTKCSFSCNSYIREVEHTQNTKHKMKDVRGLWSF